MFLLFSKGAFPKGLALFTFLLASLTDYWDGRLARMRKEITSLGKLMDPIADKILTLSAFLAFVQMGIIPAWMAVLIVARDFLITGLRFLMLQKNDNPEARPSGKHKTALQLAAIVGVLIFLTLKETPLWRLEWTAPSLHLIYWTMLFIVAITLWSGVRYLVRNKEFFGS